MTEEAGWVALGVKPELDKTSMAGFGRSLDSSLGRTARSSGHNFGRTFGKVALAGAAGIIGAGFAAFRIGQDALGEAREAQEIGRTSAAILKATGKAAGLNRKEYDKLTESLMRKTAIDDEQIAQSGNLLLTFKNIKREGKGVADIFGRTLSSALDLSAAGFGSSDSAAKMLGKALNDPVKGITALSRAGVTFSETQKETIGKMVEQNNLLGAQKLILKEVESQVGGTAAKQKTSAKELEVAWGNVKEELGFALIPVMDDLADVMLDKGIPAAREFAGWVGDEAVPALKDFAREVRPLAEKLLPAAGDAFGAMRDIGKEALPYVEGVVDAFNDMPDWMQKVLVGGVAGGAIAKKTGLLGLLTGGKGGGGGLLSKATPLPVFVVNNGLPIPKAAAATAAGGGLLATASRAALIALKKGRLVSPYNVVRQEDFDTENVGNQADFDKFLVAQEKATERSFNIVKDLLTGDGIGGGRQKALEQTFEVKTPGLGKARVDFDQLLNKSGKLDKKTVSPLVKLQGVSAAERELERLERVLDRVGNKLDTTLANALDTISLGGGPTYNAPVTYTDEEQGRRDAAQRRRRGNSDGVRRK